MFKKKKKKRIIGLEIPEWAEKTVICVMAGMEMLAIAPEGRPLKIVDKKCQRCGLCCKSKFGDWILGANDGVCNYYEEDITGLPKCKLGIYRPLGCCLDPYEEGEDFCQIRLKEISQE